MTRCGIPPAVARGQGRPAAHPALSERKMFGGLALMLDGNMCCGIVGDRLMLRLGADLAEQALERTHVQPMDFTGRPMTGMVFVATEGYAEKRCAPGSNRPQASHVRFRQSAAREPCFACQPSASPFARQRPAGATGAVRSRCSSVVGE